MRLPVDFFAFMAAGLAGIARPFILMAVMTAAIFLLLSLDSRPSQRLGLRELDRSVARETLVGVGQSCLCWAVGFALRAVAG
jgi:hypothetical protein